MKALPSFEQFYRAANKGRVPFPWQSRLAERVATGDWPSEIGVPTGLGKTACIDIAVWALAANAHLPPRERKLPTRIWYVVNRRLLVDIAHDHGEALTRILEDPAAVRADWAEVDVAAEEALQAVGNRLRNIGAGFSKRPLHVARLRGGVDLGARCPDPSQPSILFATVPMFATRWLFRGYGTSVGMRPVDAALAGVDTVVLLDEAHLAQSLMQLGDALAASDFGDPSVLLLPNRARPTIVALTATGERAGDRFDVNGSDLADPIVKERLAATKPVTLRKVPKAQELPRALSEATIALLENRPASSAVVFCNTVKTARSTFELLSKKFSGEEADVLLVTGRAREREASRLRELLLDPVSGAPASKQDERERSLVVVSTQTLEVGADLDFDFLVTQSAGVRALTQRFGRLNRLGHHPHAGAVICHVADGKDDPVYGAEPVAVWNRLEKGVPIDLNPGSIDSVLGDPQDAPPRSGTLLPAHLWELAKTSLPPSGEAPPEVFFDPLDEDSRTVTICWRSHIPTDYVRLWPGVYENESIDVPIGDVRRALQERDIESVRRLTPDRGALETVEIASVRPGDHVVLSAKLGMYDEFGWNPDAKRTVLDVAAIEKRYLALDRGDFTFLLDPAAEWRDEFDRLIAGLDPADDDDDQPDPHVDMEIAKAILRLLKDGTPHPSLQPAEWLAFLEDLDPQVQRPLDDVPYLRGAATAKNFASAEIRIEAFEELSFDLVSANLHDHVRSVGDIAAKIGSAIGLPPDIVETLQQAGYFHDLGKADPRFQRWLDPNATASELLAKSSRSLSNLDSGRMASGWPRGGRHELLSERVFQEWLAQNGAVTWDADLVAHLIASHHGGGRPLIRTVSDRQPTEVHVATVDGTPVSVHGDLSRYDFEQASRFRRQCERFGAWGVALLEAILRQADHLVSQATEEA